MVNLSSAKAKLGRANLHIEAVGKIMQSFMSPDFYTVMPEEDSKGRLLVKVVTLKQLPPEFSLAVGDAAHNMRSALDHIVYAFATQPLTGNEERRIQFPITSSVKSWRDNWRRWLPKVPSRARAIINRFQPHHRRKWPENRLLGQLQAVNNWDKHRRLAITASFIKRNEFTIQIAQGTAQLSVQKVYRGPLKVGTVLARFDVSNRSEDAQVHMKGQAVLIPIFGIGMPKEVSGLSVMNRLRKISAFIEKSVIPQFEAL
jgi:hypothetical protein